MDDELVHNNDLVEAGSSPSPMPPASEHRFTNLKLKGVGGWLLFFVIGQLVLRPARYFGNRNTTVILAEVAAKFPLSAKIIAIERVFGIGLLIAGIFVGLALLKTGTKWPVLLAKLYLVITPMLMIGLAVLYFSSDLPEASRTELITSGIMNAAGTSLICFVWFLYFTRSKRVQATYLEPDI